MTEEERSTESTSVKGTIVMPFYIVCDVSLSMTRDMPALNDALASLVLQIKSDPVIWDVTRYSILTFSDQARVVLPIGRHETAPTLGTEGGTNFGAAFRLLRSQIESDTTTLKAEERKVYRPAVFFLTDGEPQDNDWAQVYRDQLTFDMSTNTGFRYYPIFVPFGFRDAEEATLKTLAFPIDRSRYFLVRSGHSASDCFKAMAKQIMNTVVVGTRTAGTTGSTFNPAETVQDTPVFEVGRPDPNVL